MPSSPLSGPDAARSRCTPISKKDRDPPRSVIGMFDISARPFVPACTISFATPMAKFERMVENMGESFLTTASWAKVKRRIQKRSFAG